MRSESIPLSNTRFTNTDLGFDTAQSGLEHNAIALKVAALLHSIK